MIRGRAELGRRAHVAQRGRARSRQQRWEHQHPCGTLPSRGMTRAARRDQQAARLAECRGRGGKPAVPVEIVTADIERGRQAGRAPFGEQSLDRGTRPDSRQEHQAGLGRARGHCIHTRAQRRDRDRDTGAFEVVDEAFDARGHRRVDRAGEHDAARSCARGRVAGPVLSHRRSDLEQLGLVGGRHRVRTRAQPHDERCERGRVDPRADARPNPAGCVPDLPRDELHRVGERLVERDDHRRSVAREPLVHPSRGGGIEGDDDIGREGADARFTRGARAGQLQGGNFGTAGRVGRGETRLDVATYELVHQPPHPLAVGGRLAGEEDDHRPARERRPTLLRGILPGADRSEGVVHVRARVDQHPAARDHYPAVAYLELDVRAKEDRTPNRSRCGPRRPRAAFAAPSIPRARGSWHPPRAPRSRPRRRPHRPARVRAAARVVRGRSRR